MQSFYLKEKFEDFWSCLKDLVSSLSCLRKGKSKLLLSKGRERQIAQDWPDLNTIQDYFKETWESLEDFGYVTRVQSN